MANILHKPRNEFTQISNKALSDPELSLKAKGMLAFMLSKPDRPNLSIRSLTNQLHEGEMAVRRALKELRDQSYLKLESVRDNGRIVRWEYTLNDEKGD